MHDVAPSFFLNIFVYLFIPFVCAYIARKIKIPPIIGYIIGGIILGNLFNGALSKTALGDFAYVGIILLLFTVGLEVHLGKMIALKRFIVLGGILQIGLSAFFIALIGFFFNFSFLQAVLIGIALSASSTSLIAKIIQDRGEESSFIGEIALGILMFQDLAFIPFVIIFSSITSQSVSFWQVAKDVSFGIFQSMVLLWLVFYFGKKIVPLVFDRIARSSRELLNLFIIVFIFFVAYLSSIFGIPILVGVFIAGILVSQTLEHHHIFSQVRPLRDILAIIFFAYIGTSIQISSIIYLLPKIFVFAFFIMLTKALLILFIFISFKFSSRMAFGLSAFLFQIGETAFILIALALRNRIISQDQYLLIVSSILLGLVATPLIINGKEKMYTTIRLFLKKYASFVDSFIKYRVDLDPSPIDEIHIKNHVVICGYGRVGRNIGKVLLQANIPYIAIDYNFHAVERAKRNGINIIYGDPTDIDILDYAEVESAVILIAAVPEKFSQETIVMNAKKLNKNILVIARVHAEMDHRRIKDLGADIIVQPELEASISIIKKIFLMKQFSKEEIFNKIKRLKLEEGIV